MGKTLGIPGYENVVVHKSDIDMTNEQKAMEIAEEYEQGYINLAKYFGAMEMAQWKDEQHEKEKQQWIEKACEWLKDIMYFDEYGLTHKKNTMEEFINDFKKAMEEEP